MDYALRDFGEPSPSYASFSCAASGGTIVPKRPPQGGEEGQGGRAAATAWHRKGQLAAEQCETGPSSLQRAQGHAKRGRRPESRSHPQQSATSRYRELKQEPRSKPSEAKGSNQETSHAPALKQGHTAGHAAFISFPPQQVKQGPRGQQAKQAQITHQGQAAQHSRHRKAREGRRYVPVATGLLVATADAEATGRRFSSAWLVGSEISS